MSDSPKIDNDDLREQSAPSDKQQMETMAAQTPEPLQTA